MTISSRWSRPGGYHLATEQGRSLWHHKSLVMLKACGEETGEALAVGVELAAEGPTLPLHVHRAQDEAWYVLEGELLVTLGSQQLRACPGSFVYAPRGVPHGIDVRSATARFLTVWHPAGFERFYLETGWPPRRLTVPFPLEAAPLDPLTSSLSRVGVELIAGHGSSVTGSQT